MTENAPHQIATAVKQARRAQGLDQAELAMASGVATRTVSRIENAHATVQLDRVLCVLDALGITLQVEVPTDDQP